MSIIKNKLIQMILVGLLFAFILGVLSYSVQNANITSKTNYEKQIVIVDVIYKNKISEYLNKLNQIGYLSRNLEFTQELFRSLKYIKLRYQRDKQLSAGCYNLNMNLTDNSIFIETNAYQSQNKKLMDECLTNLFNLSYRRLKEKFDIYNYREISILNFELQESFVNDKFEDGKETKDFTKDDEITNKICSDLDKIVEEFNIASEDKFNNKNINIGENFLSVFNLHQSLIAAKTLDQICDNLSYEKKKKFITHLNNLNDLIAETEFKEIFKVEKISTIINETNRYLSTKNIVITFSIFGFIFGVLLFYHLGSFKDKNE